MITQQTFDTIFLGLMKQGFQQSYDNDADLCRFRGPNDSKCAIGMLIPDEQYHSGMENWGSTQFHTNDMFLDLTADEFIDLQTTHDQNHCPKAMEKAYIELAGTYGITVPRVHFFDSTDDAYNATQTREDIANGDILIVEDERVVGLAYTWPIAVTTKHGALHTVAEGKTLEADFADVFTLDQIQAARRAAKVWGFA